MVRGQAAATETEWKRFVRAFRAEMNVPTARRTLDLLAGLSHGSNFSIGCYCENEARCHRSVLRELLTERGASLEETRFQRPTLNTGRQGSVPQECRHSAYMTVVT